MPDCSFCEALTRKKQIYRFLNQDRRSEGDEPVHVQYTVALVIRSGIVGRGYKSRETDYRNRGIGFQLNFCPECGKVLRKQKNTKEEKQ